jgi:hypothetical protein
MESIEQAMAPPTLELSDLQNLLEIIAISAQRGAFRANEFTTVGRTYDRLVAFLDHTMPVTDEASTTTDDGSGDKE